MIIKKYIPQILIISQIAGLYGGMLQLPRVFGLLFLPFLLKNLNKEIYKYKIMYVFFILLILYSLLSMIILNENGLNAFKEFCYFLIHFIIVLEIFTFSKYLKTEDILNSWTIFLFLTIPIAIVEIFFNIHFSNSKFGTETIIGGLDRLKVYAAITFGNYNLYNHLIVLAFPFTLLSFKIIKNKLLRIMSLFFIISIIYIVLINASRGALICIILQLLIYIFLYSSKSFSKRFLLIFAFTLISIGGIFYVLNNDRFIFLISRLTNKGFEDNTRMDIINVGLEMFVDSNLVGVGSGNFSNIVDKKGNYLVNVPHNIFIEVISQYGIITFLFFIFLLIDIFKSIISNRDNLLNFILLSSLVTFPIAFTINSIYLNMPYFWIWLSCLYIISKRNINVNK